MKLAFAGAFACALSLAACAINPAGQETILGINTHISAAKVQVAQADVQAAITALPGLCQKFELAAAFTAAELQVLVQNAKLPAKTAANISNASAKGILICQGTTAVVAPLQTAPAGP